MFQKNPANNFFLTLTATTLFISTYYLLLPVLPIHMQLMGGTKFTIGLIMGLFSASSLIFRPLAGRASDRRGPLIIMKLSILIFFFTPLFFIFNSFLLITFVQLLYGFTIGAFTISSATTITNSIPANKMSQAIGIHSISLILAKGISPTLGTLLYKQTSIYHVIGSTLIAALAAFVITTRISAIPPQPTANELPFKKVMSHKMVWVPSLTLLTVTFTFGNIMTMLPLMALERGIEHYSWFFVVNTSAVVFTRLLTGKQTRLSHESIIALSLLAVFVSVMIIARGNTLSLLLFAAFIYGLGYGGAYPALTTLVVLNTPSEIRGVAFGLFTAFFDIGVTLGAFWGGFSEYLGFQVIYFSASLTPLVGLLIFIFFLRHQGIWRRITTFLPSPEEKGDA